MKKERPSLRRPSNFLFTYRNGDTLKKLKFIGALLLFILLVVLNICIYSRIFRLHSERAAKESSSQTGKESAGEDTAETEENTDGSIPSENTVSVGEKAEENGASGQPIIPGASTARHRKVPAVNDAVLATIPAFSVMNESENLFLNVIAGYDDNDYSYTMVNACIPEDGSPADQPAPVTLTLPPNELGRTYELQVYSTAEGKIVFLRKGLTPGSTVTIYNLTPGDICGYQIFFEEYPITLTEQDTDNQQLTLPKKFYTSGSFRTLPFEMRGIRTDSLHNVRDLGGWATLDGRHVKYGLIYRGSAFDGGQEKLISDSDTALFKDRLGIKNELDLRWDSEIMLDDVSILGNDINYRRVPMELYITFIEDEENGEQLNQIFDMLLEDGPLYFHCAIGCDRTGTLSFLLLGLLGVSESDINKEYELSSFSTYGLRTRDNPESYYREMIFHIKENYEGSSLAEKIQNYLLSRGVSIEKLNAFKAKMVE